LLKRKEKEGRKNRLAETLESEAIALKQRKKEACFPPASVNGENHWPEVNSRVA
jgi:hypothetical protein